MTRSLRLRRATYADPSPCHSPDSTAASRRSTSAPTSAVRVRVLLTRTQTRALSHTPCAPIRCVNDKFFGDDGLNFVTQDELAGKLGLGAKTKTLLLLLQHCGRLKADRSAPGGVARYSVCT